MKSEEASAEDESVENQPGLSRPVFDTGLVLLGDDDLAANAEADQQRRHDVSAVLEDVSSDSSLGRERATVSSENDTPAARPLVKLGLDKAGATTTKAGRAPHAQSLTTPVPEQADKTKLDEAESQSGLSLTYVTQSKDEEPAPSSARGVLEWLMVLVGAVVVATVCRTFLFQGFMIPSESMETSLLTGDRVMVNKVEYQFTEISHGDVIVFETPEAVTSDYDHLIKRVVGLAGEVIEGRDNQIYIDGQRLVEPYLEPDTVTSNFGPYEVPPGYLFVLGDNRSRSEDSRYFQGISEDLVVGRAFVVYWPLGRLGSL